MKKSIKINKMGSLTRAGLILNIVICAISILVYFITFIQRSVYLGQNANLLAAGRQSVIIFGIIMALIWFGLSIFSLIISILIINGRSNNILLAGILAIFTGLIIAGVFILIGNSSEMETREYNSNDEMDE